MAAFTRLSTERGNETVAHLSEVLKDLTAYIFPSKAYVKQKRYMRNGMRKPAHLTLQQWVNRVQKINSYLPEFPKPSDTQNATKLTDDELLDLMEVQIPNSWQKKMRT